MFELIPAIDVLGGNVVRLERGDYDAVTVYESDPVAVAEGFVAAGAPLVHVVDLEGARSGSPDASIRRRLGAAGIPFQIGGGLRTAAEAVAAIEDGAARVVAGTAAVWDPAELRRIVTAVGAAQLVAAVDVASGRARGAGWMDDGQPLEVVLDNLVTAGVTRVLATAIIRDGTMLGPDIDLLATVAASGLRVIASGGVGTLGDLQAIASAGAAGAIVGKAIYEGRFTVAEALAAVG
jgi:phosphoribosylformimino-5-aminoimidazole carboxamide ribotide isomerase